MNKKHQSIELPNRMGQLVIPEGTLDHILAVTVEGEVISFQLRHLLSLQPHQTSVLSAVQYLHPSGREMIRERAVIQEPPEVFWLRCENLLRALLLKDEKDINRFFAPARIPLRAMKNPGTTGN